jgi:hypothetical protein
MNIEQQLHEILYQKKGNVLELPFVNSAWDDYLSPNEYKQKNMKDLKEWDLIKDGGIVISVGTERALNTLSYNNKFTGLVCIDINTNVKLYNDFNFLLIRIANSRDEFISMRQMTKIRLLEIVAERLDTIPVYLRAYYKLNISSMINMWKNAITETLHTAAGRAPFEFDYLQDNDIFNRIQRLIRSGNCVTLIQSKLKMHKKKGLLYCGGIFDLQELTNIEISLVDSSNIRDYLISPYILPEGINTEGILECVTDSYLSKYTIIPLDIIDIGDVTGCRAARKLFLAS